MSSNKTTNYQLHLWEPEDDFIRSEFNENNEALDTALAAHDTALTTRLRIATGSYTGDGNKVKTIDLGVEAVLVFLIPDSETPDSHPAVIVKGQSAGNSSQYFANSYYCYQCDLSGTTLTITAPQNVTLNCNSILYRWAAFY